MNYRKLLLVAMQVFIAPLSLLWGQNFEYALIENDNFFIGLLEKDDGRTADVIKQCDLSSKQVPKITYPGLILNNKYFPYCWKKYDNNVVIIQGYGRLPMEAVVIIKDVKLEVRDSIKREQYYADIQKEFEKKYQDSVEVDEAMVNLLLKEVSYIKSNSLLPVYYHLGQYAYDNFADDLRKAAAALFKNLSYDFIPIDSSRFLFYVRTAKEFTIWEYNQPRLGERSKDLDWKEIVTYSADSTFTPPQHAAVLPSGDKHIFKSIQDTSFFRGHIKAIMQGNNTYIINMETGSLYLLGVKVIEKIGRIDVTAYPKWLFNKPLFIEDKDENQIIFFSKVTRQRKDLPFPKINVMRNQKTVLEKFRFAVY